MLIKLGDLKIISEVDIWGLHVTPHLVKTLILGFFFMPDIVLSTRYKDETLPYLQRAYSLPNLLDFTS